MPKVVNPETGRIDKNLPAHHVVKGDPRINGPYLDDIRAEQEDARREGRKKAREKVLNRIPEAKEETPEEEETEDGHDEE